SAKGGQQDHALRSDLLLDTRMPIVAIPQSQTTGPFSQQGSDFAVFLVGRSQKQVTNDSRPTDASMQTKAVKGLSDAMIFAIGCQPTKAATPGGTGKVANRDGHAVQDGDRRIVEQPFIPDQAPQSLFERPQIGGLTHEGGAM